jgi:tRNA nucleotidyltransferase (CCA-adding enzyme)
MVPPAPRGVPSGVRAVLERLWSSGQAAYLVGGGVRDSLLERPVTDWDVATDAVPERTLSLFPTGTYTNRFGTVTVPIEDVPGGVQVTTFRQDHVYADHRRPDSVTFTDSLEQDLARRDFTVNAIAWGRQGAGAAGESPAEPAWEDPTGGLTDLRNRTLRAVGDPHLRFDEDALRLLRAARFAAQLGVEIEPGTRAAMTATAITARWISSERVGAEVKKMVAADPPSTAFLILDETGVLQHVIPELAAQKGVPQEKITGHDLWGHSLATLDAAALIDAQNQRLRLAALLHDVGKPPTFVDGHFIGHEEEGAKLAQQMLTRFAYPRPEVDEVAALVRQHMFSYERRWSAAAVRRFIRRVGRHRVKEQIKLRRADNIGSGLPANAGHLDELEARVTVELEARAPLTLRELAVKGDDLIEVLRLPPGPVVGRLLEHLLGSVIAEPSRNDREQLLAEARRWIEREQLVAR